MIEYRRSNRQLGRLPVWRHFKVKKKNEKEERYYGVGIINRYFR